MPLTLGKIEPASGVDLRAVEQYLFREAMLLDEKRWREWLALLVLVFDPPPCDSCNTGGFFPAISAYPEIIFGSR